MQYKDVANTHTSAGGWDTVQFVVMHTMLCIKAGWYQCIQISANLVWKTTF